MTSYNYDNVARLSSTVFKLNNETVMNSHAYLCNDGFQRTRQTRADGSYVTYGYDDDG
jgi:hypothetical protein